MWTLVYLTKRETFPDPSHRTLIWRVNVDMILIALFGGQWPGRVVLQKILREFVERF